VTASFHHIHGTVNDKPTKYTCLKLKLGGDLATASTTQET
jgi:hypothetical protein